MKKLTRKRGLSASPRLNRQNKHKKFPGTMSVVLWPTITILFFISGLTGLVYEVAWTRMFTSIFGNTTYAVSAVIAAFMGGLALGSYFIGRFIDKKRQLLKIYALLELGIGIMALLMPILLRGLNSLYANLFQNLDLSAGIMLILKIVFSFAVLLIPTFLMGGTLPVLVKYFVHREIQVGTKVGFLYAINTLGATAGCFLTGFLFLEWIGINNTLLATAAINLSLAVLFLLLSLRFESSQKEETTQQPTSMSDDKGIPSKAVVLLLTGFGVAGFVSLSYEVLWSRLLIFKLNTTIYAFSIMLTTFLAGIAIGSFILTLLERLKLIKNHFRMFGFIESIIGLLGLFSIFLFGRFESISNLWETLTWTDDIFKQLFMAGLIMIIPTILMGMTLPLVTRVYTRNIRRIGSSIGKVYSLNTLGSILGSLITGFILVRWLGTQACIVLVSVIALVLGTIIVGSTSIRHRKRNIFFHKNMIFSYFFWIVAVIFLVWLPKDFLFQYYNIGEKQVNSQVEILYAHEGVECITTVHRYPDGNRVISTGSINVAGTDFTLRTTQKLQAHIPMLLHPNAKEVLQVGFGSGETSHILTTYDTDRVDVVEISRGVLETSAHYFSDINHDVLNNPKFRAIIMDGANYVALSDRKYDLILNDSIWPFYSGNSGLYTREYFEDGKKLLKEDGLMTSWLPVEMPEESFKTLLATFHSVFKHVSLWMAVTHYNKHGLIIGSDQPIQIDTEYFLERFEQFAKEDLKLIKLDDPVFFLDSFKMDEGSFKGWIQGASLHTLNRPVLEFAPRRKNPGRDRGRSYRLILRNATSVLPYLENYESVRLQGEELEVSLKMTHEATKRIMTGLVMREEGEGDFIAEFKEAMALKSDHPGAHYLMNEVANLRNYEFSNLETTDFNNLVQQGKLLLENKIYDKAVVVFEKASTLNPRSFIVLYNLGMIYYQQGLFNEALSQLNNALKRRPDYSPAYNIRGLVFYSKNQKEKAISDFSKALSFDSGYWLAMNNRGIAFASTGRFVPALEDFNMAIHLKQDYAEAYFNRGLVYQSGARALGLSENVGINKAISDYTGAITLNSYYDKAHSNRGMLYAMQGDYTSAISDFDRVVQLNPEEAEAFYNRGLAYQMSGDESRSRADFQKAVQLDPDYQQRIQ